MRSFEDRVDAGRQLGERLAEREWSDAVVLGLPRGGVPVAAEVARALDAPLDVLIVRKVGVPWHPELAMAAVGEEGAVVRNDDVIATAGVSRDELAAGERRERAEVEQRAVRFRGGRAPESLAGRTALIVDDGIATGASMRAACAIARARQAAQIVVATPVAPADVVDALASDADEIVCLSVPPDFMAVGVHYVDFGQTSDAEVIDLMS
ncbi:phosphoribosyltransferase [Microbacterium alcoholitolerans]|uniref:phosphoribosyltransferase n=1 Tax=unclassified Microbacterium TaxID=2609290 RepID=UPI003D176BF4